jgi:hypothetical protein
MAVRGNYRTRSGQSYASIELTGPFFTADPYSRMGQNIRRMLQGLADEGARVVRANINSRKMAPGIIGRVTSLRGAPWWLTAVVSAQYIYPWKERGGRAFGIQQSGLYKRGKRKGTTWTLSDASIMERMSLAEYRGGKQEGRTHAFRQASQQMKAARAVLQANLTEGLE